MDKQLVKPRLLCFTVCSCNPCYFRLKNKSPAITLRGRCNRKKCHIFPAIPGMDINRGPVARGPYFLLGPEVLRENAYSHNVKLILMAVWAPRPKKINVHPCIPRGLGAMVTTDWCISIICTVSRFTETDRNGPTKIPKRTSMGTETDFSGYQNEPEQALLIGLDSYSRQGFNYLDPILNYISL